MRTAILTDSNSGIFQKEAEELGIFTIAMPVIIDGAIRFEGIDIDEREFFALMSSGRNISTSMPSPGEVTDMWDKILAQGYDELVYIPMSSGLSNSCQAAKALADDYDGKVWVADNH
ncbi:MAG: DegV family protein, partial [Lachnospiraceae bacterium]|nr:DegV family protein [Lachnospiraceae bacterium]